jgi:hypothetical protein
MARTGTDLIFTFCTDQVKIGTGSDALNNKITPSLPFNDVSFHLDDSGRSARAAKNDMSAALAIAAQDIQHVNKHMIMTKCFIALLTVANKEQNSFELLKKTITDTTRNNNYNDSS